MNLDVKRTLRDIRMSRIMAHRADIMMEHDADGERYRMISESAWREAEEAEATIVDKLSLLSTMDRLIMEQWMDGASFQEIANAANWSVTWTNRRFNAAARLMQEKADQEVMDAYTVFDGVQASSNKK